MRRRIKAEVSAFTIRLFFQHPTADPNNVTQKLKIDPSITQKFGDSVRTPKGNILDDVYKYSKWSRSYRFYQETNIDVGISSVINELSEEDIREIVSSDWDAMLILDLPGDRSNVGRLCGDLLSRLGSLNISMEIEVFPK